MKESSKFVSYPLHRIFPNEPLPGDLFIFVNGHFIKYKNATDTIPSEKYDLFAYKRIQYVFINISEQDIYETWSLKFENKEKQELITKVGEENKDIVEHHLDIKKETLGFITKDINDEDVKVIINKTRNFIALINDKKTAHQFMAKLLTYGQSMADHGTNVAGLSTFLAVSIGYAQQLILETIYLGALLHDYGKTKIDARILENPNSNEYKKNIVKHPTLGKNTLLLESGFSDEVLRIIAEHHERFDGKGYPKNLKGHRIYDLSKIVSIANTFDNYVMTPSSLTIPERQQNAIKLLEQDDGRAFDPKILEKCVKALKTVM